MINPTKRVRMVAQTYELPSIWNVYKYYNIIFYTTTGSLKNMYKDKYSNDYYASTLRPFKVRKL